MNTDPIADLLTRIRNGVRAGNKTVLVPYSKMKESIAQILEQKGFLEKARVDRSGKFPVLSITLYEKTELLNLKRISKPGRRVFLKSDDLREVRNGFGISILSTSSGVITGEDAQQKGVGGEVLCEVY